MNSQNDEFETVIKISEIFNASAAIDDQSTIYKESQQVPGIEIESYIQTLFSNTSKFSGGYHAKEFNIVLNKVKE